MDRPTEAPQTMERQAHRLQAAARQHQEHAAAIGEWLEAKLWWIVQMSLAEAIHAMKQRRKAAGIDEKRRPLRPGRLDPKTLDYMGVAPLECQDPQPQEETHA